MQAEFYVLLFWRHISPICLNVFLCVWLYLISVSAIDRFSESETWAATSVNLEVILGYRHCSMRLAHQVQQRMHFIKPLVNYRFVLNRALYLPLAHLNSRCIFSKVLLY